MTSIHLFFAFYFLSRITGVSGTVSVDDLERDLEDFRRMSCYITQDDRLQPLLTVRENMTLASELKLGTDVPFKEKKAIVSNSSNIRKIKNAEKVIDYNDYKNCFYLIQEISIY